MALLGHPMPLGFGTARSSAFPVRSCDFAMTCGASLGDCRPRRTAPKVAQSGSIRGVFRASVHQCTRAALGSDDLRDSVVGLRPHGSRRTSALGDDIAFFSTIAVCKSRNL